MSEGEGITEEQMSRLQKWLTARTRGRSVVCGICGQSQWNVQESFVLLRAVANRGEEIGSGYPHVALSCSNCGNTMLINAVKSKIWD